MEPVHGIAPCKGGLQDRSGPSPTGEWFHAELNVQFAWSLDGGRYSYSTAPQRYERMGVILRP